MDRLARADGGYPNLYSEISSLTQANKPGYLEEALGASGFAGRLCYGSVFRSSIRPSSRRGIFPEADRVKCRHWRRSGIRGIVMSP